MDKVLLLQTKMFPHSFPPVDDFVRFMKSQDWLAHYNRFMDVIVTMCAFMAVMFTLARTAWINNNCTQRCINGWNLVQEVAIQIWQVLHAVYNCIRQSLIPNAVSIYQNSVAIYNYLRGDLLAV